MGLIRFLLAVSIICGHVPISNKLFLGAPMALHLFFMISGYSISYVLQSRYLKEKNGLTKYIISRVVRIYPMYLVVLAVTVGLALFEIFRGDTSNPLYLLTVYFNHIGLLISYIFTNIFIFGQDLSMFLSYNLGSHHFFWTHSFISETFRLDRLLFLPQAWALALELYFYALAPWFVRRSNKLLVMFLMISLMLRAWFSLNGYPFDPWAYRFFPTELFFFLLGVLAYRSQFLLYKFYGRMKINLLLIPFFICVVIFRSFPYIEFHSYQLFEWIFYPIFFFFMPYLFRQSTSNRLQMLLGSLSYPMYLTHLFIAAMVLKLHLLDPYYGLATLFFTIAASYLLNRHMNSRLLVLKNWLFSVSVREH
jgi:peptidoglycan/LPS O-acetylase OafA/YrhL